MLDAIADELWKHIDHILAAHRSFPWSNSTPGDFGAGAVL